METKPSTKEVDNVPDIETGEVPWEEWTTPEQLASLKRSADILADYIDAERKELRSRLSQLEGPDAEAAAERDDKLHQGLHVLGDAITKLTQRVRRLELRDTTAPAHRPGRGCNC